MCVCVCMCVCACVCVSVCVDLYKYWLKLITSLDLCVNEHKMLLNGVTCYISCLYTCRELAILSGRTHHYAHRTRRKRLQTWRLGTPNVQSMVSTEGCIEIASRWQDGQRRDKKVDLITDELRIYKIKVAGWWETVWFESEAYNVAGSIVLTSSWDKPADDQNHHRGEGVAERPSY